MGTIETALRYIFKVSLDANGLWSVVEVERAHQVGLSTCNIQQRLFDKVAVFSSVVLNTLHLPVFIKSFAFTVIIFYSCCPYYNQVFFRIEFGILELYLKEDKSVVSQQINLT